MDRKKRACYVWSMRKSPFRIIVQCYQRRRKCSMYLHVLLKGGCETNWTRYFKTLATWRSRVVWHLDRTLLFSSSLIDRNTEDKTTVYVTKIHTCYISAIAVLMDDIGKCQWSEKELNSLGAERRWLKTCLVETFGKHCGSGLGILVCQFLDHEGDYIQIFETIFVSESLLYDHFDGQI